MDVDCPAVLWEPAKVNVKHVYSGHEIRRVQWDCIVLSPNSGILLYKPFAYKHF